MGKAQSKRSVDITTEVKKDDVEEGTGKMEKIEDVDQLKPQINGDTHHTDNEATEKPGEEGTENEKDLSTEKEQKPQFEGGGDDSGVTASGENKTLENGDDETLNESKTTETNTAESGDSSKKKKEKVKKKWSFRSISFGKKDKQKPPKKEEVVNGECEKVPEETTEDSTAATKEQRKDEETPEATPTTATPVEDKPTPAPQPEASKPEEQLQPAAPVTNGNEPVKENASETAAECHKTEVIEPSANKGTEESTKEAAKPDEAPKECVTESPAATKIEVKDDVKTEVAVDKSATKESGKGDGDSEVAQNPPPPLPSTPPPSQVMVFALSGTEKPSETEQPQTPPSVTEQPVKKASESEKPPNEPATTASTVEMAADAAVASATAIEQVPPAEDVKLPTEENKVIEDITVQKVAEVREESQVLKGVGDIDKEVLESVQEKKDTPISEEVKQKEDTTPSQAAKDAIKGEETVSAPATEEKKVIDQLIGKNIKLEGDINPEQIAQTIALIDEVTQEAAAITQQKIESPAEPAAEQKHISQDEIQSKSKTTKIETSCNAPVPEDKSISPPTAPKVPENTSIIDTQIPPVAAPSPVEEKIEKMEEKKEASKIDEKTETVSDCKPSESIKEEKSLETQTEPLEKKPEQTEQKIEVSEQAEKAKAVTESKPAVEAKTESALEGVKLETQQEPAHTPASKENGVGDHPTAVESVPASSDSQSDCKTVEVVEVASPQIDTTTHVSSDSGADHGGSGGGNDGGNGGGDGGVSSAN